jgi:hypothetical protein
MKLMERAKMLNVPDISGSVFRLIYDAVDANDIAPCLLDRKYLRNVINNYIDCEADEIDEDEQGDFIDLGREAMDQFETLEDSEIVVLLAMVQGFSLAENADGCCPACVWDDFITHVYGENSDQIDEESAEAVAA